MRRKREKVELTGDEEQIVSFRLGKSTFAVSVNQVREIGKVQDITKIPKMPNYIEGVMNLRGQITTVIDLRKRFNIDDGVGGRTAQSSHHRGRGRRHPDRDNRRLGGGCDAGSQEQHLPAA